MALSSLELGWQDHPSADHDQVVGAIFGLAADCGLYSFVVSLNVEKCGQSGELLRQFDTMTVHVVFWEKLEELG